MSRATTDGFYKEQKWIKLSLWYIYLIPMCLAVLGPTVTTEARRVPFSSSCSWACLRRPKLIRRVLEGKGLGRSSGRNPIREERERMTPKASYSSGLAFQNLGEHSHQSLFTMSGLWSKKAYGADKKEASRSSLNEAESPEFCNAALLKIEVSKL